MIKTENTPVNFSEDQLKDLWADYRQGNQNTHALKKLIEYYAPLVNNVVHKLAIRCYGIMSEEEMFSAGILGLHEAIRRFDKDNNYSFAKYAACRIRGAVIDDLRRNDPLNRYQRTMVKNIQEAISDYQAEYGRSPTNYEVAEKIGTDESSIEKYLGMNGNLISLEQEIEDGCSLEEVLADENSRGPREHVDAQIDAEIVKKTLKILPLREQKLLYLRYYEELSVKEIATVLEVTSSRVSQLYNAALEKMRIAIQNGDGSFILG